MRKLSTIPIMMLLLVSALPAFGQPPKTHPGLCPDGYTKVEFEGSLSWTADADYASVILVGGPPGPGRNQIFTDVAAGDILTRTEFEISHICVTTATTTTEGPTSTTSPPTSTTLPDESTTTSTTTTTTETTPPSSTTTTTENQPTTTTLSSPPTSGTTPTTTSSTDPPTTATSIARADILPLTGFDHRLLALAGLGLAIVGLAVIARSQKDQ